MSENIKPDDESTNIAVEVNTIPIFVMGRRYDVPEGLTI